MVFNTAIFYDIENLIKGYGSSEQGLANFSLKEIFENIRKTNQLGEIAIQRAYANWSNSRLGSMRAEINELGIDPIQIFGFSSEQKKNAADIQLVIDAIDLAYVRPGLEVFVIVSGDGGFASLAKKLHEYGKTVIGCAYKNAASKVFQAVCDDFVYITYSDESNLDEEVQSERYLHSVNKTSDKRFQEGDPRLNGLAKSIKPLTERVSNDEIIVKSKEVINWFMNNKDFREDMVNSGIKLSVIKDGIERVIPKFQVSQIGFVKFIEYLQCVCKNTEMCVARSENPQNRDPHLILRTSVPGKLECLPDKEINERHSKENYYSILEYKNHPPKFRLPSQEKLHAIAMWIFKNRLNEEDFNNVIEKAAETLAPEVNSEAIKFALISLIDAEIISEQVLGEPENQERRLSLKNNFQTPDSILDTLRNAVRQNIETFLGEVKDELIKQLV